MTCPVLHEAGNGAGVCCSISHVLVRYLLLCVVFVAEQSDGRILTAADAKPVVSDEADGAEQVSMF